MEAITGGWDHDGHGICIHVPGHVCVAYPY